MTSARPQRNLPIVYMVEQFRLSKSRTTVKTSLFHHAAGQQDRGRVSVTVVGSSQMGARPVRPPAEVGADPYKLVPFPPGGNRQLRHRSRAMPAFLDLTSFLLGPLHRNRPGDEQPVRVPEFAALEELRLSRSSRR
jgi:hypothetical protein